jgi:hypothetical protein
VPLQAFDVNGGAAQVENNDVIINQSSDSSSGAYLIRTAGAERWVIGHVGGTSDLQIVWSNSTGNLRLLPGGGNVGIGTTAPHAVLDVNSTSIIIEQSNTPADNATCTAGTIWWDTGYIYLCTASGTVKRAALSTF